MKKPALIILLTSLGGLLFSAGPAIAEPPCPPCLEFDRLDKQIRDGKLPRAEAEHRFREVVARLDDHLAGGSPGKAVAWVFPLPGQNLASTGAAADQGYVTAGYDYFDGNRHGGHPSYDLFIHDRNRDSRDDATGEPVIVRAMTAGVVVAAEPQWAETSTLRGGRYLWIYEPVEHLLIYYAHNRDLLVAVGDRVMPGTPIATVGRSGFNAYRQRSPTHLHLTVLRLENGRPRPINILPRLAKLPRQD